MVDGEEDKEERGAPALSLMGGAAWGEEDVRVGDSGSANLGMKGGTLTLSLSSGSPQNADPGGAQPFLHPQSGDPKGVDGRAAGRQEVRGRVRLTGHLKGNHRAVLPEALPSEEYICSLFRVPYALYESLCSTMRD